MDVSLSPACAPAGLSALGTLPRRPAETAAPVRPAGRTEVGSDSSLETLVGRVACQDTQALEQLYRRTIGHVHGLARRIVGSAAVAEEVCEEVYLQAWQTAARFDAGRGAVLAWLLTICRSRAIDALRRADPAQLHPDPASLLTLPPADLASPDALLEAARGHAELHAALRLLDGPQRQLVGLAFFRGLSHAELANQLGWPLGTVKSRMRDALRTLRDRLG